MKQAIIGVFLSLFLSDLLKGSPSTLPDNFYPDNFYQDVLLDSNGRILWKVINYLPDQALLNLQYTCKAFHQKIEDIVRTHPHLYYIKIIDGIMDPKKIPPAIIPKGLIFDPLIETLLSEAIEFRFDRLSSKKKEIALKKWSGFNFPFHSKMIYNMEKYQEAKDAIYRAAVLAGAPWVQHTAVSAGDSTYESAMQSNNPMVLHQAYYLLNRADPDDKDTFNPGLPINRKASDIYRRGKALMQWWPRYRKFFNIPLRELPDELWHYMQKDIQRHTYWSMQRSLSRFSPHPNSLPDLESATFLLYDHLNEPHHRIRPKAQVISLIRNYTLQDNYQDYLNAAKQKIRQKKLSPFIEKCIIDKIRREAFEKVRKVKIYPTGQKWQAEE